MSASKDEPLFSRPKTEARSRMLTVRVTEGQEKILLAVAKALGIDKAEVVRQALDYWLLTGPEAGRVRGMLGQRSSK